MDKHPITEQFPFEAWDSVADRPVTVLGWDGDNLQPFYRIEPGGFAWPPEITTAFPAWYIRARQADAAAADADDTERCALDRSVQ
jgi:hypothetical protein